MSPAGRPRPRPSPVATACSACSPRPSPTGAGGARDERPELRVVEPAARRRRSWQVGTVAGGLLFLAMFVVVGAQALIVQQQSHIDDVNKRIAVAEAEAEQLKIDLAELQSPVRILREAQDRLGMVQAPSPVYLLPQADDDSRAAEVPPASPPATVAKVSTPGPSASGVELEDHHTHVRGVEGRRRDDSHHGWGPVTPPGPGAPPLDPPAVRRSLELARVRPTTPCRPLRRDRLPGPRTASEPTVRLDRARPRPVGRRPPAAAPRHGGRSAAGRSDRARAAAGPHPDPSAAGRRVTDRVGRAVAHAGGALQEARARHRMVVRQPPGRQRRAPLVGRPPQAPARRARRAGQPLRPRWRRRSSTSRSSRRTATCPSARRSAPTPRCWPPSGARSSTATATSWPSPGRPSRCSSTRP